MNETETRSRADDPDFDEQVYAALVARPVQSAGVIARDLGRCTPQAVAAAFGRLANQGRVRRAGRSATCWEIVRRA